MSHTHPPYPSTVIYAEAWSLAKAGNVAAQNEDAYKIERLANGESETVLIALSDGATEAVYSRLWAKALVDASRADWPTLCDDDLSDCLKELGRGFSPMNTAAPVPWFVRNKFLSQGSQATLLVVTLEASGDAGAIKLRAVAVGDCCLIAFRQTGDALAFPLRSSEEFGLTPALVRNRSDEPLRFDRFEMTLAAGDLLLVASDAVAKWTLQRLELNQKRLLLEEVLALIAPPETSTAADADVAPSPFETFIERYRVAAPLLHMRNDDSTLVFCSFIRTAK